jgi:hypothetical protein
MDQNLEFRFESIDFMPWFNAVLYFTVMAECGISLGKALFVIRCMAGDALPLCRRALIKGGIEILFLGLAIWGAVWQGRSSPSCSSSTPMRLLDREMIGRRATIAALVAGIGSTASISVRDEYRESPSPLGPPRLSQTDRRIFRRHADLSQPGQFAPTLRTID